jgi:hypothetical protein
MSVQVISRDLTTLPTALLSMAKRHCRIDWDYDDSLVMSVIARAIARFEQTNEVTINPTTVLWIPAPEEFTASGAPTPVRPITAFIATSGATDISANYAIVLKWDSIHGVPIQLLEGAMPTTGGLELMLQLGYTTTSLPPAVLDVVMRHTAHLFEHREILIPGREYLAPDLQVDASWWLPKA